MQRPSAASRRATTTTLKAVLALCLGCQTSPPPTLHYSETATPPSGAFWIAADTQLHNVTAGPSFWRSERVDSYTPGAIRPPSVDLWSGLVLRSILETITSKAASSGGPSPLFYLGDAADISCTTEFRRFLGIMTETRRSGGPWFVALGNHDGFYEGNITRRPDIPAPPARAPNPGDASDPFDKPATSAVWSDACFAEHDSRLKSMDRLITFERDYLIGGKDKQERDSLRRTHAHQGSLAKATSTLLYLDNLHERKLVAKDPLRKESWTAGKVHDENGRDEDVLRYATDTTYEFLGKPLRYHVRASITPMPGLDDDRQWRAYVVQDVELADGSHVLLVDTSDLSRTPLSKYRNGLPSSWQQLFSCNGDTPVLILGECGAFSHSQREDAEALMKQWPAGTRYFAMGHHPLFTLSSEAISELLPLFAKGEFSGYVSAHTHNPPSIARIPSKDRWEVNIGSTTDWPVHYAKVNYWRDFTIKVDIFRPATKATCPYADVEHSARGLAKYIDRAMANYRAIFAWIRSNLSADELATLDRVARDLGLGCSGGGCLAAFETDLRATKDTPIDTRRERLAALVRYDQDVLQSNPRVRDLEAGCSLYQSEHDVDAQSARGTIKNGIALPLTEGKPLLPPRGE